MAGSTTDASTRRTYLSRALKALRRRRNMGAAELAAALGMPLRSYQHFESGRSRVNVDRVHEVARVLNGDAYALLAAADLASPAFAVRAADNKLMTIIVMALKDFDAAAGDEIIQLDPRILTSTFERVFGELAAHARQRAEIARRWTRPSDPSDDDPDGT